MWIAICVKNKKLCIDFYAFSTFVYPLSKLDQPYLLLFSISLVAVVRDRPIKNIVNFTTVNLQGGELMLLWGAKIGRVLSVCITKGMAPSPCRKKSEYPNWQTRAAGHMYAYRAIVLARTIFIILLV